MASTFGECVRPITESAQLAGPHDHRAGKYDPAPTAGPGGSATEPETPAVVVLTSGTTGRPKGVVLSHRAMAASADARPAVPESELLWRAGDVNHNLVRLPVHLRRSTT